jgi:hypothetical protein
MSYVKISDPSIIDLAAWHQVITVVNQHSDSLTSITNNFGQGGTPDWTQPTYSHQYDPGSQAIIFGRAQILANDVDRTPDSSAYWGTVSFADSTSGAGSFASIPVVTATVYPGNTSGADSTTVNDDIIISVYNIKQNQFSFRLHRANPTTNDNKSSLLSEAVWVNWIAIGPKGQG